MYMIVYVYAYIHIDSSDPKVKSPFAEWIFMVFWPQKLLWGHHVVARAGAKDLLLDKGILAEQIIFEPTTMPN